MKDIQSKLKTSSQKKNIHKISYTRKCKLKSITRARTRGSRNHSQCENLGRNPVDKFNPSKGQFAGNEEFSDFNHRGDLDDSCHGGGNKKQQRRRCKRKKEIVVQDETYRLQNRTRYLLVKMKLEQNLIDAYSGEGWKGNRQEKIKPEKELERARRQIMKCKLGIRDVIQHLDILSREGRIDDSVMFPDGSVFHEHIFCAICKSCEASQDDDIILCDGVCNRAFHQKCLEPPLTKIPPGDQGWFCKFCACKIELVESVNAHLGTDFSVDSYWEDIFKEAAIPPATENNYLDPGLEWPSDDSADDDYDPEGSDRGDDRETTKVYVSDKVRSCSSSPCSSDQASFLSGLPLDSVKSGGSSQFNPKTKDEGNLFNSKIPDSDDSRTHEIKSYQRQRRNVDYRKLYDEMFGKELIENNQQSEDEDWGPYRRKRRGIPSDTVATAISNNEREESLKLISPKVNKEKTDSLSQYRKILFRIPPDALEKLRQVFSENELPPRSVKENLSNELGIAIEKVSKWFKNARYASLRVKKEESIEVHGDTSRQNPHQNIRNKRSPKDHAPSSHTGVDVDKNTMILQKGSCSANILHSDSDVVEAKMQSGRRKASSQRKTIILKERTALQVGGQSEANDHNELYFDELERLCNLEERLEKLKKALKECEDHCNELDGTQSSGPHIVYVPVIEIKEKA